MSEGGSIKNQIEQVKKELHAEQREWQKAGLPPPDDIWRLGDQEFFTHVHVLALDTILREIVGSDKMELEIKKVYLQQVKEARKLAMQIRSDAVRDNIVRGINVIKPPESI
jgi:hypothetical protein